MARTPQQASQETRTPQQVLDEIDTLRQALAGLSSAVRERTRSETSSARNSARSSPSLVDQTPGPFRQLTLGERELERTKSSVRKPQEERTVARIEQLEGVDDRRRASYAHGSSELSDQDDTTTTREAECCGF